MNTSVTKEISVKSIIYPNIKKMSSKKCLEKHLRFKDAERKVKEKKEKKQNRFFIIKAGDKK